MSDQHRWFVVVDSQKARLLRGARTAKGSPHLEEVAALASTFVHGQHQRPDRLGAPGRSAGVNHEHEEKLAHFAREVVPWMQKEFSAHTIATCALFAPAHTMGALRKELGKPLASRLVEYEVELAGLPLAQLGSHPRILAVLDS